MAFRLSEQNKFAMLYNNIYVPVDNNNNNSINKSNLCPLVVNAKVGYIRGVWVFINFLTDIWGPTVQCRPQTPK